MRSNNLFDRIFLLFFFMIRSLIFAPFIFFLLACQGSTLPNLELTVTKLDEGKVVVEANAEGAKIYRFSFGDSSEFFEQSGSGIKEYNYENNGDYLITVWAFFNSENLDDFSTNSVNISISNALGNNTSGQFIDNSEQATIYPGYTLVFSDEFNYQGMPLDSKWHMQYKPIFGSTWANGELQHYTRRIENAEVGNGTLKITAKRESYTYNSSTLNFTSARLNSKFDFTYGRVDVRAKLPSKQGTWPAIWTLGSNINELGNYFGNSKGSVGWPECGEIDILEQKGDNKQKTLGTFHWRDESSGNSSYGLETNVSNVSTEYHLYSLIWTSNSLKILVDNQVFVEMNNKIGEEEFRNPHYLLLNIAMGGSLGGQVPSDFDSDIMEIDYVRIYQ